MDVVLKLQDVELDSWGRGMGVEMYPLVGSFRCFYFREVVKVGRKKISIQTGTDSFIGTVNTRVRELRSVVIKGKLSFVDINDGAVVRAN